MTRATALSDLPSEGREDSTRPEGSADVSRGTCSLAGDPEDVEVRKGRRARVAGQSRVVRGRGAEDENASARRHEGPQGGQGEGEGAQGDGTGRRTFEL